jgi:Mitochondrial carrier protein
VLLGSRTPHTGTGGPQSNNQQLYQHDPGRWPDEHFTEGSLLRTHCTTQRNLAQAMSFDSNPPPTPPPAISQYASATDPPSKSRSFNTMSSPKPPLHSSISRLQIHSTQIPAAYITPLCGAGAGIASGIVTCPLDVIKTKLQAQGGFAAKKNGRISPSSAMYSGMIGTARVIWRDEGLRGLYRGLNPMLLGYLPTWAVYLTVYEKSKNFYETQFSKGPFTSPEKLLT